MIKPIFKNIKKDYLVIIVFSIVFSLLYFFITPFYDSTNQDIDSFVFRSCGYFSDQGLIVYKDFLDNKGPMLHLFNFLFYKFQFVNLLYITSLLIIFINNIFIYKISKLYLNDKLSIIIVFFVNAFFISVSSQYGFNITNNMAEFFAIPFFTYEYYKYKTKKKWKKSDIILSGVFFSILFLLRANLACICVICSLLIIYNYIKNNNYKMVIHYIVFYILGFLIIIGPTIIYFIYNNAFSNLINDYLGFNMLYSAYGAKVSFIGGGILGFLVRCIINFIKFSMNPYIIFILCFYLDCFIKRIFSKSIVDKKINEEFIIFVFCYAFSIFVSNRFHMHYIWIIPIFLIYPMCIFIKKISMISILKYIYKLVFIISAIYYLLGIYGHINLKVKDTGFSNEYILMKEYINNNKEGNHTVFAAIDPANDLYYTTHTLPGNRYIYQYFYEYFYESHLMDDFVNSMIDNPPERVIYKKNQYKTKSDETILLICSLEYKIEYENNLYIIYKKK